MKASEYLKFTKRERYGILSLMLLVLIVIIIPRFTCTPEPLAANSTIKTIEKLDTQEKEYPEKHRYGDAKDINNRYKKFEHSKQARYKVDPVEINAADTSAFIALPGIGSKLAARIILFREKLGGYYDVHQVGEVYGLQDSVFRKLLPFLKCKRESIRKININEASEETLKVHPYIRWKIAEALVTYRSAHGAFASMDDLSRLESIRPEDLKKMIPYLSFK